LTGIQFMWRELIEANNQQGCLLAHTMGLGKSMQV
jgi:SNF2 family DNA or RNA helicase